MRFLIISILGLAVISCASYPKRMGFTNQAPNTEPLTNRYFANPETDYIYKADIQAFDRTFGGIFIVKKQGLNHHRIAFTTELGNKIFDFTFREGQFTVNHILKELDRKPLIKVLKNDFKVLIKEHPMAIKSFENRSTSLSQVTIDSKNHFYFVTQDRLHKIIRAKNGRAKVEFLFSEINGDLANHIRIIHRNLNLAIDLKAI